MNLIILFGPPAVGKTTIGTLLEQKLGYRLFHNHMIMDGVMHIFGRGSPSEDRLSKVIRTAVIQEAADAKIDLIFTYVWNFSREKGKHNIDTYKHIYEAQGGNVYFVELVADLPVRVIRAEDTARYILKPHAPTPAQVADQSDPAKFQSPMPFYYPSNYLKVNTTHKTPNEVLHAITLWLNSF